MERALCAVVTENNNNQFVKANVTACKTISFLAVAAPAISAYYQYQRITIQIHSDRQSYALFCALATARLLHKKTLRFAAGDYGR